MLGKETIDAEIFKLYKIETKESDFDTAEAFAQSPKYKKYAEEWQKNFALNKYTIKTALEQLWVDKKNAWLVGPDSSQIFTTIR